MVYDMTIQAGEFPVGMGATTLTGSFRVTLATCTAPTTTTQPPSRTITRGQSTILSVTATGTTPLGYQWYTDASGNTGSPVPNGTGSSITVSPTSTPSYWVRISNSCGSASSNTALVTVNQVHQKTPVDFNGDHISDIVLYRSGTCVAYNQSNGAEIWRFTTNNFNDGIPLPMDWDGDGLFEFTIFRPAVGWYLYNDNGSLLRLISITTAGAVPAPADYDGNGTDDLVVYRSGTWYKHDSTSGALLWSVTTDNFSDGVPVPMDWDGDGRAEFTVWRPGLNWHFYNEDGTYASGLWIGLSTTAVPVPGDYDGDGSEEPVVFNRDNPSWLFYRLNPSQFLGSISTPGGTVKM